MLKKSKSEANWYRDQSVRSKDVIPCLKSTKKAQELIAKEVANEVKYNMILENKLRDVQNRFFNEKQEINLLEEKIRKLQYKYNESVVFQKKIKQRVINLKRSNEYLKSENKKTENLEKYISKDTMNKAKMNLDNFYKDKIEDLRQFYRQSTNYRIN